MIKRLSALAAVCTGALLLSACGGNTGAGTTLPTGTSSNGASNVGQQSSAQALTSFQRDLQSGRVAASCATAAPGEARCFAYFLTNAGRSMLSVRTPQGVPSGYGPAQLQGAYGTATLIGSQALNPGSGPTVAIVDAYDDPNAENDLGVYRSQYGLGSCTTANGCFKKVNQSGGTKMPTKNASWAQEISLDLDMVSANCPNCKILLVEASSASFSNLSAGVNTAAKLGAVAISNSYGGSESSTETSIAPSYNHPGIAITASAGDNGYGAQSPAAFNTLTAVGGTSLHLSGNAYGSETVWSGSGSGCSAYISKPSWQTDPSCSNRMIADVGYIGDPNTGVAVYDSLAYQGYSGWMVFGGTSVGAPAIAAIYALSGNTSGVPAALAYSNKSSLHDVTSGSNGSCSVAYFCNGEVGYDGPTGNGTPNGTAAF